MTRCHHLATCHATLMTTATGLPPQSKFGPHVARDAIDPGPLVAECCHWPVLPTEIDLMGLVASFITSLPPERRRVGAHIL